MRLWWLSAVRWIVPALLLSGSGWCTVLFSETGTPDATWSDDGDLDDWMIGFREQDVINAGWGGTEAEAAWLLDPWHSPENRVLAVGLLKSSPDTKDAENLPHNASGVVTFSDVGAGSTFDVAYYRVRVHSP